MTICRKLISSDNSTKETRGGDAAERKNLKSRVSGLSRGREANI